MIHLKVFDLAMTMFHKEELDGINARIDRLKNTIDVGTDELLQFRLESCIMHSWLGFPGIRDMVTNYLYRSKEDILANLDIWINEIAKILAIVRFMDETRKAFQPQQGAGSQNCDYPVYRALFATCEQIMKEDELKWEDDDIDDEEIAA
jgi:hypothetical protein